MAPASTSRRAWALAALAPVLLAATGVVAVSGGRSVRDAIGDIVGVGLVFSLCLPLLGALVIRGRGGHAVGWLMIGIGVSIAFHTMTITWAQVALVDDPGSVPGGSLASWFGVWAWLPGWALATTLLPVLFPDGRPAGRRRLLAWTDAIAVAIAAGAIAAVAWHLRGPLLVQGRDLPAPATLNRVGAAAFAVIGVLTLVSMGSLLSRYRHAAPDVRRQIAWAVYGAAVAVVVSVVGTFVDVGGLFQVLEAGALVGGLAVAILRYRLYDIDVVINRTLVYGALTATLAGTYLVSVLLLQLGLGAASARASRSPSRRWRSRRCSGPPERDPGCRRPALLPSPLRRGADARALRRAPARRGRPRALAAELRGSSRERSSPPTSRSGCVAEDDR